MHARRNILTAALIATLSLVFCATNAHAVTIATWGFSGGTTQPGSAATPNTTAVSLTRGPGLTPRTSDSTFNSAGWTQGGNLSTAMSGNDYYQFGVTLDAGYAADFTQFVTRLDRSGTGPGTAHLVVSNNNFATFTDLGTNGISETGATETWNFNVAGLTGTVLFRIYGYGASGSTGTLDFEDTLVLSGTTPSLVPEPASLALLGAGALMLVRRRRQA